MKPHSLLHLIFAGLLLACCGLSTGCTTTYAAQNSAKALALQISSYQQEQKTRVDAVNANYNDTFNRLMDNYVSLWQMQLQQQRAADAQGIADSLISDDKSTLIGTMRNSFQQKMAGQRQAIANANIAIAAARSDYAKAYSKAKLDLTKIQLVSSNLKALTQPEEWTDVFKNSTHVVQLMVTTAQNAQKDVESAKGATPLKAKPATPAPPK